VLARYAEQLALRLLEIFQQSPLTDNPTPGRTAIFKQIKDLTAALLQRRKSGRAGLGRSIFPGQPPTAGSSGFHHLLGIRSCLDVLTDHEATPRIIRENGGSEYVRPWLRAEADAASVIEKHHGWSTRLDAAFPGGFWRDLERRAPLTFEQDALLRDLIGQVPPIDPTDLANTLHPALRKMLLASWAAEIHR